MAERVLIVGAGIGGLTLAHALARRGVAVEVVDRGPVPNPAASSADEHRVIRHAYGPHRGYGRMMPAAFAAWGRLLPDIGVAGFARTGSLFALRGADTWIRGSAAVMAETGVALVPVGADALARRFPMLSPEGVTAAFETEADGILFPRRILAALVNRLAAAGVRLRPFTEAIDVDPERGRVRVAGGELSADRVVVAAGAWMPRLVPEHAGGAVASRQAVVYLAPPAHLAEAWSRAPVLVDFDGANGVYAVPGREGTRLKLGDHVFTRAGGPDDDRTVTAHDLARLLTAARRNWRDFDDYTVLEARTCYYTVREGERFLVRRIGAKGHVLSACSGHGFKFAPLVGEGLAAAIAGERDDAEVEAWAAGMG